jgi:ABC transport system ATP-binding/permease protein
LPARIESLEREQRETNELLADGTIYREDPERAVELAERIAAIESELMAALERWEALGAV